ncbi:hypothetical protein SERLA73DRAFT_149052 [Serpula lacrymans var. lacrymans S7.3]|uniref:Uncharacterized protein n=1 Tax=Serpula lacrymans var. lacrymans (strain S7.3) TaxID=936435 RepID=F8PI34_SERL3|nr:hypothetical protein SERLA73DRAFT_149052 [Serpula lacrymans var. lacrymans S7.3]
MPTEGPVMEEEPMNIADKLHNNVEEFNGNGDVKIGGAGREVDVGLDRVRQQIVSYVMHSIGQNWSYKVWVDNNNGDKMEDEETCEYKTDADANSTNSNFEMTENREGENGDTCSESLVWIKLAESIEQHLLVLGK